MPPRRSLARNAATPARSIRGSSALPLDSSVSRRVTRASSAQPSVNDDVVNNPQLPDLQTQQSYAYGSNKTPFLPDQLVAREKLSLKEMAATIDEGIRQADKRFEEHAAEAQGQMGPTSQPDRTRRAQSKSKDIVHEPLKETNKLEMQKKEMVAAWADSLESSQLDDIDEEHSTSPSTSSAETRKDTDPSSFPSGIFDHSYNYERGKRQSSKPVQRESRLRSTAKHVNDRAKDYGRTVSLAVKSFVQNTSDWSQHIKGAAKTSASKIFASSYFATLAKGVAGLALAAVIGYLFCSVYTSYLCDLNSTTLITSNLQKLCGSCNAPATSLKFSEQQFQDPAKLSTAFNNLNKQIHALEKRLSDQMSSKYSHLQSNIEELRNHQSELSHQLAALDNSNDQQSPSSGSIASPLMSKINFFAPSNGAIVNPHLTSPTRRKPYPFVQRVAMRMLGMSKYQSKSPITALEPWHDIGDCWCGSDAPQQSTEQYPTHDSARLAITIKDFVYPVELVLEHYPAGGSPTPNTAPKRVELWADFAHLDAEEYSKLNLGQMQGSNIGVHGLPPTYAPIGTADYDASPGRNHVQAFRLDVNQNGIDAESVHFAKHFVVRVIENYGSEHTCLYRVRLHGIPMGQGTISEDISRQ